VLGIVVSYDAAESGPEYKCYFGLATSGDGFQFDRVSDRPDLSPSVEGFDGDQAVGQDKFYRLGALLLDVHDPAQVLQRTPDWLMQPEADYEIDEFYKGVCFPCGTVVLNNTLFFYI
jgi:beta-1,4-mannooligosaccharide phosphorylase